MTLVELRDVGGVVLARGWRNGTPSRWEAVKPGDVPEYLAAVAFFTRARGRRDLRVEGSDLRHDQLPPVRLPRILRKVVDHTYAANRLVGELRRPGPGDRQGA